MYDDTTKNRMGGDRLLWMVVNHHELLGIWKHAIIIVPTATK